MQRVEQRGDREGKRQVAVLLSISRREGTMPSVGRTRAALVSTVLSLGSLSTCFQTHSQSARWASSFRLSSSTGSTAAVDAAAKADAALDPAETRRLFALLSDTAVLRDPSSGQCCRNRCSGCVYLDPSGRFLYDEWTASDPSGGWIAPYERLDVGETVATSSWGQLLFSDGRGTDAKTMEGFLEQPPARKNEVERSDFARLLGVQEGDAGGEGEAGDDMAISRLAVQCLWSVLSPSVGYPRLSSAEVCRAVKGTDGSSSEMGGAMDLETFEAAMIRAAERILERGGIDAYASGGDASAATAAVDYDAMSKDELLALVDERGMVRVPKMVSLSADLIHVWLNSSSDKRIIVNVCVSTETVLDRGTQVLRRARQAGETAPGEEHAELKQTINDVCII